MRSATPRNTTVWFGWLDEEVNTQRVRGELQEPVDNMYDNVKALVHVRLPGTIKVFFTFESMIYHTFEGMKIKVKMW